MNRSEVVLDPNLRTVACRAMGQALVYHDVELVDLSVSAVHFHILARFTPLGGTPGEGLRIPGLQRASLDEFEKLKRVARHWVGVAKKRSSRDLSDAGLVAPGGIWGVRGHIHPVRDRAHQLRVVRYIRDHCRKEGAAVWSMLPEDGK